MTPERKKAAAQDAINVLRSTWAWNPPCGRTGRTTMLTAVNYYNRHHYKSADRLNETERLIARHIPLRTNLDAITTDERRAMCSAARIEIEAEMKEIR